MEDMITTAVNEVLKDLHVNEVVNVAFVRQHIDSDKFNVQIKDARIPKGVIRKSFDVDPHDVIDGKQGDPPTVELLKVLIRPEIEKLLFSK